MGLIQQIIVLGITTSALYALMAIGLTMIFSIGGIANLAHGAFLTLSAYIFYVVYESTGILLISLLAGVVAVGIFSIGIYRIFIEPVMHEPLTAINVALILGIIVEEAAGILVSHQPRTIPLLLSGTTEVIGVSVTTNRLLAFTVSWILLVGIGYFVSKTLTGQAILGMSMDKKGAATVGINVDRHEVLVWFLAGVLAAFAGYFLGTFTSITPSMGIEPLLISLVIVVLGGLGSITGSVIAAYIVGMLETTVALAIDPAAQGLVSLILLLFVMIYRPKGLLGKRELHLGGDH